MAARRYRCEIHDDVHAMMMARGYAGFSTACAPRTVYAAYADAHTRVAHVTLTSCRHAETQPLPGESSITVYAIKMRGDSLRGYALAKSATHKIYVKGSTDGRCAAATATR